MTRVTHPFFKKTDPLENEKSQANPQDIDVDSNRVLRLYHRYDDCLPILPCSRLTVDGDTTF